MKRFWKFCAALAVVWLVIGGVALIAFYPPVLVGLLLLIGTSMIAWAVSGVFK